MVSSAEVFGMRIKRTRFRIQFLQALQPMGSSASLPSNPLTALAEHPVTPHDGGAPVATGSLPKPRGVVLFLIRRMG